MIIIIRIIILKIIMNKNYNNNIKIIYDNCNVNNYILY